VVENIVRRFRERVARREREGETAAARSPVGLRAARARAGAPGALRAAGGTA